jgi:probable FeS assembly SUF system protein SufT
MPEMISLKRDCNAIAVPSGRREVLTSGTQVRLMQSRGGSYTVSTSFHAMYRIDAVDADALGLEAPAQPQPSKKETFSEELVWNALKTVYDPEIPVNIVDLGLVYGCPIHPGENGNSINIRMAMTAPGCGMGNVLKSDVEAKLFRLPQVTDVRVEIIFDPPWTPNRMSEAARLQLGLDFAQGPSPRLTQIS